VGQEISTRLFAEIAFAPSCSDSSFSFVGLHTTTRKRRMKKDSISGVNSIEHIKEKREERTLSEGFSQIL